MGDYLVLLFTLVIRTKLAAAASQLRHTSSPNTKPHKTQNTPPKNNEQTIRPILLPLANIPRLIARACAAVRLARVEFHFP
mmetsp:Transcript_32400/g.78426  ORF Transcript_32400/g.78426 Transcript_32400/m.78426 type:complete len:81 (-) Transcript_32400:1553-1795(-)